jgi:hypothetical protein
MVFSFKTTCCFAICLLSLSRSATADTVRGVSRRLQEKEAEVDLKSAGNYVILAKTGITTVPQSVVTGDIAVSPIVGESMTGFSFTRDASNEFSTSGQVTGKAYASNDGGVTPARLTVAVGHMDTAYTNAAGRPNADAARINIGTGLLGGVFGGAGYELTPGVYTFSTGIAILGEIFFKGSGTAKGQGDTDVFIIQVAGNLLQSANTKVTLTNGALAKNIFWQIAGNVAVSAGAHLEGTLLVKTDVTFITGSSLNGRVFSQTACALQMATITQSE